MRELGFGLGGDGGDDARAQPRRHLREQEAHTACACVHQRGVASLERKRGMAEIMRGHALEHGGSRALHAQPVGNLDQLRGGNQSVLNVTADHAGGGNCIPSRESRHARSQFLDSARGFAAWNKGQCGLVDALAEVNFDEVDPSGLNANQDLARSRLRNRQVFQLQNFRPACGMNLDGFHD